MSLVLADRVRETTTSTGTGTITLGGAVTGFQSFSVIGNNNTTYYTIAGGSQWEVGIGTYYGGTLARTTVIASSTGSKLDLATGTKDVFVDLPAEQLVISVAGRTGEVSLSNTDISGLGTMSTQNANTVAITGGTATLTSLTTPTVQATNSGGLSLKNSAGTTQISMGGGGGDNISLNVSTNLNGANAQIDISPTGTGHVHINPSGSGSIQMNPTSVGTMDNMTIGATTPKDATFLNVSATTGTVSTAPSAANDIVNKTYADGLAAKWG